MAGTSGWDTIMDWVQKLGIGGALGWLAKTAWSSFGARIKRGRTLVDQARPELLPLGWEGSNWQGRVRLKNVGPGVARQLRLRLSSCSREERGGEVQPRQEGHTAELFFEDQPIFLEKQKNSLWLTIIYADKYGNDYSTMIPVEQYKRDDGRYNLRILWGAYKIEQPLLSWLSLWKIGKY